MSKHTPGPWFEHREGFSTVYIEARIGGGVIQEVAACGPTEAGSEQQSANARLISAAPDLLEALEDMVSLVKSRCYPQPDKPSSDWGRAEAAELIIKKAKGES